MSKVRKKRRFSADNLELTILGTPTVIWFLLFSYLPMFGAVIAFKRYKPLGDNFIDSLLKSEWVGLSNFTFMFKTPDAFRVFRNTLLYNFAFIALGMVVAVTLAILITSLYSKLLAKFCQTMMFLPHFLSWVVVSYFTFSFLSADKGLFNQLLKAAGNDPVQWYMQVSYWPFILIIVYLWKVMGYSMVVYMASIAGIDTSLYEAASIDGASKWQQTKYITIPMMKPIMIIMFILSLGNIFRSDFGLFFLVPRESGPLFNVTQTLDVYVYYALMRLNNIGFGSAAAFMQSVFGLITILSANFIVRKISPENSLI